MLVFVSKFTRTLNLPQQLPLDLYLKRVVVYGIRLRQPSDKHVAGRAYGHFDWPVIRRGHQVTYTLPFSLRSKAQ